MLQSVWAGQRREVQQRLGLPLVDDAQLQQQPGEERADLGERDLLRRVQARRLQRLADLTAVEEDGHHVGAHALQDLQGGEGQGGRESGQRQS